VILTVRARAAPGKSSVTRWPLIRWSWARFLTASNAWSRTRRQGRGKRAKHGLAGANVSRPGRLR